MSLRGIFCAHDLLSFYIQQLVSAKASKLAVTAEAQAAQERANPAQPLPTAARPGRPEAAAPLAQEKVPIVFARSHDAPCNGRGEPALLPPLPRHHLRLGRRGEPAAAALLTEPGPAARPRAPSMGGPAAFRPHLAASSRSPADGTASLGSCREGKPRPREPRAAAHPPPGRALPRRCRSRVRPPPATRSPGGGDARPQVTAGADGGADGAGATGGCCGPALPGEDGRPPPPRIKLYSPLSRQSGGR